MTSDVKLLLLQQGDPRLTELDLWLNGDSDMETLIHALQGNRTVCSASMLYTTNSMIPSTMYRKALLSLLETLGSITTLRKLCITGPTSRTNSFPLEALGLFLKCAVHCKRFSLGRLIVEGSEEDFEQLATSIERSCLQEVYMNGSILAGGLLRVEGSQERVMHALSLLSTLRTLTLNGTGMAHQFHYNASSFSFSLQSLSFVCQSKTLSKLLLYDFDLTDSHIEQLSAHVNDNSSRLREVRLSSCAIGARGLGALARIQQSRTSRLQVLHLWIKQLTWDKGSKDGWFNLASALQSSQLRDFRILCGARQQLVAKEALPFSTGVVQAAFCQALHNNYQLEEFSMLYSRDIQAKIAFYLKLNKLGRGNLFRGTWSNRNGGLHKGSGRSLCAGRERWIDVLIASRYDLSCLFYFLSANPALCSL